MKKNISINISGIIFHIEEDGYEQLKKYLESINNYFSTFDDSTEIVADIESRIAEIFLAKLTEDKQVIAMDDVDNLIKTMGSISDFEAIEEPEKEPVPKAEPEAQQESEKASQESQRPSDDQPKRLFRDKKRKLLGGVAAGIAYYFSVDPLWIRLLFAVFLIGGIPGAGVLVIVYIVFWIVVPSSDELEEDTRIKKMYRNPEGKVLGGVANGLAAYFGTDVTIVRIIFFISIFLGGAGLILYIILWIITPEAKTITEKMQMQGEPVTLSGIESTIKEGLKVDEGEENIFVKILLFPFRLIAAIFSGLAKALGPLMLFLVEVIRVFAGALMILLGISTIFAMLVGVGVIAGLIRSPEYFFVGDLPLSFFTDAFPLLPSIALFIAIVVPSFVLTALGVSVIAKRILFNATFGWSMFALWILSVLTLAFTAPSALVEYKSEGKYRSTETYDLAGKTAVLQLNDLGGDSYKATTLKIRGYSDSTVKLVKEFQSFGKSRKDAEENASKISYNVDQRDSILVFDSNITFSGDDVFRWQELDMVLYFPFGQKFQIDEEMALIIRNTLHRYDYRVSDLEGNTWTFDRQGLQCLTCSGNMSDEESTSEREQDIDFEAYYDSDPLPGYFKEYELDNVDRVVISSLATVNIIGSRESKMIISGDEELADLHNVDIYNNTMNIEHQSKLIDYDEKPDRSRLKIDIYLPEINDIKLEGATDAFLTGYNQGDLHVEMSAAARLKMEGSFDELKTELEGASHLKLRGDCDRLVVDAGGSARLDAFDFESDEVEVEAGGASQVRVNASEYLNIESSGLSNVRYRGEAVVSIDKSGASTVSRY